MPRLTPAPQDAHAAAYERLAVPVLFAGWATSLVALAPPAPGARVLDVGCGTGIVARRVARLAGPGGRVDALDSDPAMLAVARQVAQPPGAPVAWHEGDAAALPFEDASFDAVFSQQTLQFLEDPEAALREMRRVVRPGGRVAVDTWRGVREGPAAHALGSALARHLGTEAAGELGAPCVLGDPGSLGAAASAGGLEVLHTGLLEQLVAEPARRVLALAALITSLGPWLDALDGEARRALEHDLDAALSRHPLPVEACVAVGRR